VLSTGAKRLVVLFLVLGVAQYVAGGVVSATTTSNARKTTEARSDLTAAHNTLAGQIQQYQQQVTACPAPVQLSYVQSAERELAAAFAAYATELRRIEFPASAQAEAAELEDLADQFATALRERADAGSPEEYQRLAADSEQLGSSFDQQEQALVSSLSA
jgi:DNA repair exonuclease SbcCD ATPase subunit